VDHEVDVRTGALAKGGELVANGADHLALRIQLREVIAAREAGGVLAGAVVEQEDVGLERGEAPGDDLPAGGDHVVERAQRRDLHRLGPGQAVGAAMRPVQADALAHRPAEQLVDRHAQRLRLDVQKSVLDCADRLLDHASARLAAERVKQGADRLVAPRVLADDRRREVLDRGRHALAAERFVVLAPADQPLVGADLEEIEVPMPGIGVQALEPGDLHGLASLPYATLVPPSAPREPECSRFRRREAQKRSSRPSDRRARLAFSPAARPSAGAFLLPRTAPQPYSVSSSW